MAPSQDTFFVTGATGNQGGALARQLLSAGYNVNALVRNPDSAAAAALSKLGATLIKGDFDNPSALATAAANCSGVFLNTSPTPVSEHEVTQATAIIAAAKAAGAQRIVYSSVTRAEEHESFPTWDPHGTKAGYWTAKTRIQELVKDAGFAGWTILQPAFIMNNWISPMAKWYWPELAREHTLLTAFAADTLVHVTDPDDIGRFAVAALTSEATGLNGEVIRVAGDELTIVEIAREMSRVSGTEVKVKIRSDEEIDRLKGNNPFVLSQLWQRLTPIGGGSQVDLGKVRSYGVPVTSFKEFLERHREALIEAFE